MERELKYLQEELADPARPFLVILGGVVTGLLVGFVWEWLREHRHRAEARTNRREAQKLGREVEQLRGKRNENRDEILALVEDAEAAR